MIEGKITTAEEVKVQIETLQGPQGERGAQGPQGERGERGPQGIQGPAGARGEKGDRGERGEKGATGERGPQGLPGRDGADGRDGAAGARGPQGAQGPQGERGEPGPAGRDGVDGIQGFSPIVDLERLDDGVLITVQNKDGNKIAKVFDGKNAENKLEDVFIIHFNEYVNASQEPIEEIINAIDAGKVVIGVTPSGVIYEYAGLKTYINKASETAHTFQTHIDPFNRNAVSRFTQIKTDNSGFVSSGQNISAKNPYKLILSGAVSARYDGSEQVTVNIPAGGGGLPEGGEPNTMLVTDADGNAKWEERTHWKEDGVIDYFPAAKVSFNGGLGNIATPFAQPLVEGETYTVTINGVDYVSVAESFNNNGNIYLLLGNGGAFGIPDTGEPFGLMYVPPELLATTGGVYGLLAFDMGGASEVTLRVWSGGVVYHKLALDYLPFAATREVFLPDVTLESEDGSFIYNEPLKGTVEIGKNYNVTWNGVSYDCEANTLEMEGVAFRALGNVGALTGGDLSEEPFAILIVPDAFVSAMGASLVAIGMEGLTQVTFGISGGSKIDSSALALDWVAKYDDVGATIVAETVAQGNGAEVAAADTSFFVEGNSFIAYVDNVRYDLTVVNYEGQLAAGNLGLVVPGAPGKGEPFYITAKEGKLTFFRAWSDDNDALHTISVYLPGSSQRVPNQKLPDAFLPGTGVYYVDLANGEANRGFDEIVSAYNLGRTVCCRIYDDMTTDSKLYYLTRVAVYNGKIYFSSFLDGEMTEITIDRYDRETEKYNKVTIRKYDLNLPAAEGVGF